MNLGDYFIAPDAHGTVWLWRERGDFPVQVLSQHDLRHDPDVWAFLAAFIKEKP